MILNSTYELKQHVGVAGTFEFEDIAPYIKKAINKFTKRFVGNLHEQLDNNQENNEIHSEAREYLQAALANFAMYLYIPIGSVLIDGSGISISQGQDRVQPEWQRVKDLQRDFLSAGHEAMDQLLALMENNPDEFQEWVESPAYTQKNKVLVNNTGTFNEYYSIYDSRQTYLALIPSMIQVEDQYLKTFLCADLIKNLKETTPTGAKLEVKEALQKAVIAFTVAKVFKEGIFHLDASGIKLRFEALPTDKVQTPDYGKPANWVAETVERQTANGNNYLELVKQIIIANPLEFNFCNGDPILDNGTVAGSFKPYNTSGVVGI